MTNNILDIVPAVKQKMNSKKGIDPLAGHLARYFMFYEVIIILFNLAGLYLEFRYGYPLLLAASLFLLCSLYALVPFTAFTGPDLQWKEKVILRLYFWFLSVTLLGMIFYLRQWPLKEHLLGTGIVGTLLVLLLLLIPGRVSGSMMKKKRGYMARSLILLIVGVSLMVLGKG